jgi:hypothetical protein
MANTIYNVSYGSEGAEGKTHWLNCGILIVKDDGKMSLKMNCLPVGECTGWFGIFPKDDAKTTSTKPATPVDDFEL